jgi:hypothetical protein
LQKDKYQPFFSPDKNKYVSFVEAVIENDAKTKQTIFNIKEATGSGNYKDVESWNISEIYDYLNFKEKQIKNLSSKTNFNTNE